MRRADLEVITAGLEKGPVKCSRGTVLVPDTTIKDILDKSFSMIVLPGGLAGADNLDKDPRVHEIIKKIFANGGFIGAICAAPKVLANIGLLDGKRATAYPGILKLSNTGLISLSEESIVKDGSIITSRGPGTAMDFSLELIQILLGKSKRNEVEEKLKRF